MSVERRVNDPVDFLAIGISALDLDPETARQANHKLKVAIKTFLKSLTLSNFSGKAD
jgi:hypothetical protein